MPKQIWVTVDSAPSDKFCQALQDFMEMQGYDMEEDGQWEGQGRTWQCSYVVIDEEH